MEISTGILSGSDSNFDGSIAWATLRQKGVWLKAPPIPTLREYHFLKITEKKNNMGSLPAPSVTVESVSIWIQPNQTYSEPYELAALPDLVAGSDMSANCRLLPVEFVPDWNRDGMINDEDSGKATAENPFMFWVNDDDDDNPEPELADVPGADDDTDGEDMAVNGPRDLVDFFPVQLRIKELLEVLPPEEHTYKISHPTGALHFIEMPNVQPDSQRINGAGSYLADETKAAEAMARPMKDTAGNGSELSAEYLDAVKNGMGVLLFESKAATDQSFELIVSKNGGGEVARIARALPIELDDVEKMYWRANIRPAAYGQPTPTDPVPPAWDKFRDSRKNRWFVFCHGYNVSENRARGWNAEVFKRLHQMGSDSKFLGVTWEGNQGQTDEDLILFGGKTPDYWGNVFNAFRSSAALSALVNGQSGGGKVIAGHSLGNMLVSSAICDHGLNSEQYFLLNAAVARESFSPGHVQTDRTLVRHPDWENVETRLWPTDYWTLFPANDGRRKLTWQGRFSTLATKTNPHNYYSSGEEVLKDGNGNKPNLLFDIAMKGERAWVRQEMDKGSLLKKLVSGVKQSNGGWEFNGIWNGNPPPPAQNDLLKTDPYFKPFSEFLYPNGDVRSIHGPQGSQTAAEYAPRSFLLGHDLPAISNPTGSNEVVGFSLDPEDTNSNMPAKLKAGNWGDWEHSDLKNEPMGRVWKLFSDMVSRGNLNDRFIPPPTE